MYSVMSFFKTKLVFILMVYFIIYLIFLLRFNSSRRKVWFIIFCFLYRIPKIGLFYFDCIKFSSRINISVKLVSWLSFPRSIILRIFIFSYFSLKFQNMIFKFPCERYRPFTTNYYLDESILQKPLLLKSNK